MARTAALSSVARKAWFSLSTVAAGVVAGATMPYQLLDSTPVMPCSASVFTSGKSGWRVGAAMPSGLSLPPWM
nr:hypothetical protein [Streptomyces anatolicus]